MTHVTDAPPPEVGADLDALRADLDAQLPAKELDWNLLIATWNSWKSRLQWLLASGVQGAKPPSSTSEPAVSE